MATNPSELYDSLLLRQFYGFYDEVIRHKNLAHRRRIADFPPVPDMPGPEDEQAEEEKPSAHPILIVLQKCLEDQVLEARRLGGEYGVRFYKQAQYVMAALADEIFVNLAWEGKEDWKKNLLEFKLFGTHVAGDRIFQNIDKLIRDRDPADVEMAAIYFLAISLGFRGKYRDKDDGGQLEFYRRQLYAFIYQKNPDLFTGQKKLFEEPYVHTLTQGASEKLPYLRNWIFLIIGLVILYLILSHQVWVGATSDLASLVEKIFGEFGRMR